MDLSVITTYRCNSKCQMCYIWQNPTDPREEITIDVLKKLPGGFDNVNITGGEPTLRKDLGEICDVLYPKARTLEISSNGLHHERLIPIIKKYPNIKIRFSVEGIDEINNLIRGEVGGFQKKVQGLQELKNIGGTDLGFAIVIQDENVDQLMRIYELATSMRVELSTSTLHNGWQFHKNDNYHYDRKRSAKEVEKLITKMLKTYSIKNWFRAYMNLGLIEKILGHERLHPCVAGTGFIFLDPWSDVWACNVRKDLKVGNLNTETWEEIINSNKTAEAIAEVKICKQNCWMVTTARTAMRSSILPQLPKWGPLGWVLRNKIRVSFLKKPIEFNNYVDYGQILPNKITSKTSEVVSVDQIKRNSYLDVKMKKTIQHQSEPHYRHDEYFNR